jgi:predicted NAD/FAD-binding protein
VQKIAEALPSVRLDDPVRRVERSSRAGQVTVHSRHGVAHFDQVVMACHSDESLALLDDADAAERAVLEGVRYQPNRAVLHTDTALLPQNRRTWSAWNYASDGRDEPQVAVTYLLNRLQPLPFASPVMVSLNPLQEPAPDRVLAEFSYTHPVFDQRALHAQRALSDAQGRRQVWFAGAWTGYGFHEDGLKSGLSVAQSINALLAQTRKAA